MNIELVFKNKLPFGENCKSVQQILTESKRLVEMQRIKLPFGENCKSVQQILTESKRLVEMQRMSYRLVKAKSQYDRFSVSHRGWLKCCR